MSSEQTNTDLAQVLRDVEKQHNQVQPTGDDVVWTCTCGRWNGGFFDDHVRLAQADAVLAAGWRKTDVVRWQYRIKGPNSGGRAFTEDLAVAEARLKDYDMYLKHGNVHKIQRRERHGEWVPVDEKGGEWWLT